MSYGLDPDQDLLALLWVQTVCKGYQQMTKVPLASKELNVCVIAIKQRNSKGGVPNLPTHGFG